MLQAGKPSYAPDPQFEAAVQGAKSLSELINAIGCPQQAPELLQRLNREGYETVHDVVQYLDGEFFAAQSFPRIISK